MDAATARPYATQTSRRGVRLRTSSTKKMVSQTATAAVIAYARPSTPSRLTRGIATNTIAAMTATRFEKSSVPSTTTPATAMPTAMELGRRTESSDAPNSVIQKCMNR